MGGVRALIKELIFKYKIGKSKFAIRLRINWPPKDGVLLSNFIEL
jgi:hypothetical protein